MALYNLDEAAAIIKLETGFGVTPRILCDFGRAADGKFLRIFIAYKGKATSKATGDIDIPSGRYFEVMQSILFEFEMGDSIKIPALFDVENGDTLLIHPPIIATIDKLRVDVSDIRCIINEGIAILKQRLHNQKLAQALINSKKPHAEGAPITQVDNAKDGVVKGEQKRVIKQSNAPAPTSPIKGSSYVSRPNPFDTNVKGAADWKYWKHITTVELWQALLLSFNINPPGNGWLIDNAPGRTGDIPYAYLDKHGLTDVFICRWKLIRNRLETLAAQAGLPANIELTNFISLFYFTKLAIQFEWDNLPSELLRLATEEAAPITQADNDNGANAKKWTNEKLKEVSDFYNNEKNVKKTRAFLQATATNYGVTPRRIEQLLKKYEKNKPNAFGLKLQQLVRTS